MKNILGISCYYHDAAAVLAQDGKVVAGAEEERFTRRKHDAGFPKNAIRFSLDYAKVRASDVDLAVFYDKPLKKLERALVSAREFGDRADGLINWHLSNYVHRESRIADDLAALLDREVPVQYCEHHLSHAASVFYISPFDRAAILTVDGVGEWATTGLYVGTPGGIEQLKEIRYPHSLGLFYAMMTAFLGFEVNEGEYKVMGLASYGKPTYGDQMTQLLSSLRRWQLCQQSRLLCLYVRRPGNVYAQAHGIAGPGARSQRTGNRAAHESCGVDAEAVRRCAD